MPMRLAQGVGLGRPGIRMRGGVPSSLLNGLLGYWSLEGSSLNRVTGLTGTDTAVTYGAGKVGQGAEFNGTTSHIVTTVVGPLGAAPRTVSLWFVRLATGGELVPLVYGIGVRATFAVASTGSAIEIELSGEKYAFGTFSLGAWHHFAATYDGTTLRGYLDGVQGTPLVIALNTASAPCIIGSYHSSYAYWPGSIDEVALANRAWTEAEVLTHYNAGAGKAYPF